MRTVTQAFSFFSHGALLLLLIQRNDAFEIYSTGFKRTRTSTAQSRCLIPVEQCNTPILSKTITAMYQRSMISDFDDILRSIEGETMLSVNKCLEIYQSVKMEVDEADKAVPVKFIDSSWWHKGDFNGRELFENGPRIPGSKHIDIDDISARSDLFPDLNPKNLPHMFPPKSLFSATMDAYNIQSSDHIIIYARKGVIFTPRIWFLFKSMGHDPTKVHLLQGSLEDWMEAGGDVDTGFTVIPKAKDLSLRKELKYTARDAYNVCGIQEVLNTVHLDGPSLDKNAVIIDSRGSSFVQGHIPGATHIPYSCFVDSENFLKFKSKNDLLDVFAQAGIDVMDKRKIICSCGSGVSACHVYLALEQCGRINEKRNTVIYDGSWAEWALDATTPKTII